MDTDKFINGVFKEKSNLWNSSYKETNMEQPILLVEDDLAQRTLLRILLQEMDINVIEAENGKDALNILKKRILIFT